MGIIKTGTEVDITIENCVFYPKGKITVSHKCEDIPKKVIMDGLDILPGGTIILLRNKVLLETGFDIYNEL